MAVNLVCVNDRRRRRTTSSRCHHVVRIVARARGVPPTQMLSSTRLSPDIAGARQLAMYLSHVLLGMTMTEVGRFFARDRTTVAHACAMIEDSREDPRVDRFIEALETRICRRIKPAMPEGAPAMEASHAGR